MATHVGTFFNALQKRLAITLETSRSVLEHPVSKGDSTESAWLELLRNHLPTRYSVGRGIIVDSNGDKSDVIDLIIYDRHFTPLIFNQHGEIVIAAEAVYAVFEAKQELDKGNVEYAAAKAASVRKLNRTSGSVVDVGKEVDGRKPADILAGILTTSAGWNPAFGDSFKDLITGLKGEERLDLGVIVNDGSFEISETDGSLTLVEGGNSLLHFFYKLAWRLQRIGSVPAIDYSAYLKILDTPE